jgi:hypothetical protein
LHNPSAHIRPNPSLTRNPPSHQLTDIYTSPATYLNGTIAPLTTTGFENHCNLNYTVCTEEYEGRSPDSYFWFDELHPR